MVKEHTVSSAICSITGKTLKAAGYMGLVFTGISALTTVEVNTDLTYTLDVPINMALDPGKVKVTFDGSIGPAHANTSGNFEPGNYTNSGFLGDGVFNLGSWSGEFDFQEVFTDITLELAKTGVMSIQGNIPMSGKLTGPVLSINISSLLNFGPAVFGGISLSLIAGGHVLDVIAESNKKTIPVQTIIVSSRGSEGERSWREFTAPSSGKNDNENSSWVELTRLSSNADGIELERV